jgi:hypothetical protein
MGKAIRVPDPVYSKVTTQAEREDVPRGVVVREWMEKAEKFDEMEGRRR